MANPGEGVVNVSTTDASLTVELEDGRSLSVPLAWFPRLLHASQQKRDDWEVARGGFGIHWPSIDEDLSGEGRLRGAPDPRFCALSGKHCPSYAALTVILLLPRFPANYSVLAFVDLK